MPFAFVRAVTVNIVCLTVLGVRALNVASRALDAVRAGSLRSWAVLVSGCTAVAAAILGGRACVTASSAPVALRPRINRISIVVTSHRITFHYH